MPSISACVQSYRNSGRAACAASPNGTVLVLIDPRNRHQFLLNNFPACYQRFATCSVGFSLRLTTSHSKLQPPNHSRTSQPAHYAPTSRLPDRPPPSFENFLSK